MRLFIFILILWLAGCSNSDNPTDGNGNNNYQVTKAFSNLTFNRLVGLEHAGDGSNRLFVVEQAGVIRLFDNDPAAGSSSVFLDIQNQVDDRANEEGLLGLAFHPDFANNGYFYVNYTASNPDRTVIARFQVSNQNADEADASSELEILTFNQPHDNHNGGKLAFGSDGYLYIAVGDGGAAGDPDGNGQNRSNLLGSILRIDVDNPENGNNYGIPDSNPFVGNSEGFREEIFAYGLRNPWRFSFDTETGDLWAGDVGQNRYEEVDIIESGGNYGWNIMEGAHCHSPSRGCNQTDLKKPVVEYDHDLGGSITGGHVYRGATLNNLNGLYIYADFTSGRIWSLNYTNNTNIQNRLLINSDLLISSFGVDEGNELYICDLEGSIYKLVETEE